MYITESLCCIPETNMTHLTILQLFKKAVNPINNNNAALVRRIICPILYPRDKWGVQKKEVKAEKK